MVIIPQNEFRLETEVILCTCQSSRHQIIVQYDIKDNLVYLTIHLNKPTLWQRIMYLLGYHKDSFDEIILDPRDKDKILNIYSTLNNSNIKF